MRIKCWKCQDGYVYGKISKTYLTCVICHGKGYVHNLHADNTMHRITDGEEVKTGFYSDLSALDKRIWRFITITDAKPLLIETSLCKLFNAFFGFNLLTHPVYSLHDLKGYYV
jgi:hypothetical protein